jgi:hypothetical protein
LIDMKYMLQSPSRSTPGNYLIGRFLGEMQPEISLRNSGKPRRGYSPNETSVLQLFVNCKEFELCRGRAVLSFEF